MTENERLKLCVDIAKVQTRNSIETIQTCVQEMGYLINLLQVLSDKFETMIPVKKGGD